MEMFQKDKEKELKISYDVTNEIKLDDEDFMVLNGIFHCKTIHPKSIMQIIYKLPYNTLIVVHAHNQRSYDKFVDKKFFMGKGHDFPFVYNDIFDGTQDSVNIFLEKHKDSKIHYLKEEEIILPGLKHMVSEEKSIAYKPTDELEIDLNEYEKELIKKED